MIPRVLLLILPAIPCMAQDAPKKEPAPAHAKVDQKRVDEAIRKGASWLKANGVNNPSDANKETPELILWTLVHAGVPETDPAFRDLLKSMLEIPLERTYKVSLQAMILEELDRVRYQMRIAGCAQFLADNQCLNGQWSYGGNTVTPSGTPTGGEKPSVPSAPTTARDFGASPAPGARQKPKVVRKVTVRRLREGPATGDNSNAQYAALGLRACHDAGIVLPKDLLDRARKWWRDSQHENEGPEPKDVATGDAAKAYPPAGWCYGPKDHGHKTYGSMTAGAVGSLAIFGHILGEKDWKKDPALGKGLAWLDKNYSVTGNPGPAEHMAELGWMHFYYLYALERAGVLAGTETFGAHEWYPEGADVILTAQAADGSWLCAKPHPDRSNLTNQVWDTCFAILFLKRATRPLEDVASIDRFRPK